MMRLIKKINRTRWLHLRMTPSEYNLVHSRFSKTTCRKFSDYVRSILLDKPVVTTYRNASIDELMREMAVLNKELNAIGHNINQIAKKLHTVQVPEWHQVISLYEIENRKVFNISEDIKALLQVLINRWLR